MTRAQRIALAVWRRVSMRRFAAPKVSENAGLYSDESAKWIAYAEARGGLALRGLALRDWQ
jgi:hypothetical protein